MNQTKDHAAVEEKPAETPDIPDLKVPKEDKERRKGGAAFASRSGRGPWSGAVGGRGAARAAASSQALWRTAAPGFSRLPFGSFLARLLAMPALRFIFAAVLMAAGAAGISALGSRIELAPPAATPELDALKSSLKLSRKASDSSGLRRLAPADRPSAERILIAGAPRSEPVLDPSEPAGPKFFPKRHLRKKRSAESDQTTSARWNPKGAKTVASHVSPLRAGAAAKAAPGAEVHVARWAPLAQSPAERGLAGRMSRSAASLLGSIDLGKRTGLSKSLAQLRGMTSYNEAMRDSQQTAAEPSAAAASAQFEGVKKGSDAQPALLGGETPVTGGVQSSGSERQQASQGPAKETTGVVAVSGDGGVSACTQDQLNAGYVADGNSCSQKAPAAKPVNATPWQPLVDISLAVILLASAMLMTATALVLLAGVLVDDQPELAAICYAAAYGLCVLCLTLAASLVVDAALIVYLGGPLEGLLVGGAAGAIGVGAVLTLANEGSTYMTLLGGALGGATAAIALRVGLPEVAKSFGIKVDGNVLPAGN